MVHHSRRPFLVDTHLLEDQQQGADVVLVSKDVFNEAKAHEEHRYVALSDRTSKRWNTYRVRASSEHKVSTIYLPASIYKILGDGPVFARFAKPIPLTSILISFPTTTYHLVKDETHDLQSYATAGHVFRTGDAVDINGYRGRLTFCEPVCQGILSPSTELVLAKEQSAEDASNPYGDISEDEDEDEDNLSQAMFSSLLQGSRLETTDIDGRASMTASLKKSAQSGQFPCKPLASRILSTMITPAVSEHEDDNFRIFASMETLVQLGCFSGDFVAVALGDVTDESPRALKIYSLPLGVAEFHTDVVFMSPILYANIFGTHSKAETPKVISIIRSEMAIHYPVAKSVTLSRIPSPASTDRALSNAFFAALKSHFENARRIVRAGDLVLLGIDETLARVLSTDDEDSNFMTGLADDNNSLDTVGWFKVTEVEVDNEEHCPSDVEVDAATTRMIQSGVVKSKIPPISQWAGYCGLPAVLAHNHASEDPYNKLYNLVSATFGKTARKAHASASILLHGARGVGKRTLAASIAGDIGMHLLELNCYDIVGETDVKTEAYLRLKFEKAGQCSPCLLLLRNIDALAKKKDDMESGQESAMRFILADCLALVAVESGSQFPVAVVATTADKDKVPDGVLGCFRHEVEIGAPSETERLGMLKTLVHNLPLAPDVSIQSLAVRSAALVASDLVNVVKKAQNFASDRMDELASRNDDFDPEDLLIAGGWITAGDFDQATSEARRNYSDSIGAPKIPNVTWDDVGGLASVKDDIMDTIQLPLERPELFSSGMKKRSGILFYGPPGTGKTLLAKAVATSFSLNFFSVKGPELLNMYIGESEANVRRVFQRARDAKPCVVFFDELDSVAPKRGNQGDSGGVMDRIVSQLLSELDGMAEGKDGSGGVFVIGATNRPDLLDPALLRPGRFDKMLYLGISDTDDAQYNILSALTRKFKLAPSLDLRDIAKICPFTYTGADFYALCSDAMLKAMTRQAGLVDTKVKALDPPRTTQYFFDHLAKSEDVDVVVSEVDFKAALKELVPSVSQTELDHYKQVQAQFNPVKKEQITVDSGKGKGKVMESLANGTNGHFQMDGDADDEHLYA